MHKWEDPIVTAHCHKMAWARVKGNFEKGEEGSAEAPAPSSAAQARLHWVRRFSESEENAAPLSAQGGGV